MSVRLGTGSYPYRRRWRDGPTWSWLCRVFGHQRNWWHWYAGISDQFAAAINGRFGGSSRVTPSWHYHGTGSMKGELCGRCDQVIPD